MRSTQDDTVAEATLHDTASGTVVTERFDLVVGADGLRSTVRSLSFGPQEYLHPLNYMIAVTLLDEPIEGFGLHEGLILAEPGRSAWTFPFRNHPPSLLFSYRTGDIDAEFARPPIESIRAAFGPQPAGPLLESLAGGELLGTMLRRRPDDLPGALRAWEARMLQEAGDPG
ncbi:hypothetical protein ABT294_17930 [Nonomuraea sp. NPDC000554]|uniref:hypothetical protein n=1 Tax=Nonomuraea sp. NPDC000554 TaxID=3154259 RepID=UPI0033278983